MNLSVSPNGGIYYSEPSYSGGWNIEVSPDGIITDLKTGQRYESLLWEGYGLHYPEITAGWTVKRSNISDFLGQKLTILGLNEKEITDFKAYWVQKLSEKPYYEIAFLTQDQVNALAPLNFSVVPDRIIRVIMTVKGLDMPISIPEQILPEIPQRTGFTIVEWGGALLK